MVETHWETLAGTELRYDDRTWSLTGDVELRVTGELVDLQARRVDGTKHERATLRFALHDSPDSPNPGHLREVFPEVERRRGRHTLVVRVDPKTYRYQLQSLEYE